MPVALLALFFKRHILRGNHVAVVNCQIFRHQPTDTTMSAAQPVLICSRIIKVRLKERR
jgi:hypothetical protein